MSYTSAFVVVDSFSAATSSASASSSNMALLASASTTEYSFIATELRGAAMKLHTTKQAPKEGQVEARPEAEHVTTHAEYLRFLVDSKHVYKALEEVVNETDDLAIFRNTGLERTQALTQDIQWMAQEFGLDDDDVVSYVGPYGKEYAEYIRSFHDNIPAFLCHYYNFYFAHTAGGRMIGKQLSSALLDKRTLEFYKWPAGDLNDIKAKVKDDIEAMVATWSREQKDICVAETAAAFRYGGSINKYLKGQ